jgi:hypothetical protein
LLSTLGNGIARLVGPAVGLLVVAALTAGDAGAG